MRALIRNSNLLLLTGLIGVFSSAAAAAAIPPEQLAFFEAKVRPILSESCYRCHSAAEGKSKGGLSLDTREGLRTGGDSGPGVVAGEPEKSLLIKAVTYLDPDLQMPPKGEKLTDAQIKDLTEWVKMGAPDPREAKAGSKLSGLTDGARAHWAFQPVKLVQVPTAKNGQWCRTPVDRFILSKLEEKGMLPSPDAAKETLIRRAYLDLVGLPPTPAEVQAFVSDNSPAAFVKVVDRLLASPHYGERWGRFWLDTARYADTIGGDRNSRREDYRYAHAWTYRDYVIRAFNEDRPYTEFIKEQLAADLMPESKADPTKLAALGFLTVGERFNNNNDLINDRIDVVTKGLLGLTVSCARCHDHMFDPVSQKDYYALHGVFSSITEPQEKPVIAKPPASILADFQAKKEVIERDNREVYYRFAGKVNAEVGDKIADYLVASSYYGRRNQDATQREAFQKIAKEAKLDDEYVDIVLRSVRSDHPVFGAFRLFAKIDPTRFPEYAPGILSEIRGTNPKAMRKYNPLVVEAFKKVESVYSVEDVAKVYTGIFDAVKGQRGAYINAAAAATAPGVQVKGFAPEVVELLTAVTPVLPANELTTPKLREMFARLPNRLQNRVPFAFSKINELELTHPGAPARAMLVEDKPKPVNSPVFLRGQAETKGALVPRRFIDVLSPGGTAPQFTNGSGRLELAEAIASSQNPLTARVLVNRVWMHHFGEGFVRTPDDLGTQSEKPTHPELVDYLATYVMENGWSLKKLHRLIMLSRTYQVSSHTRAEYELIDPDNRYLWRANIRRLDFESLRDSLLSFTGNLDRTIGGKPINLTEEPYSFRRSVYGFIDRGNVPELMSFFDFADPDMPNSKRASTLVPQQALFLMNSPMAVDVTRRILARADVAGTPDGLSRIFAIYRVIFQRSPRKDEIALATNFLGIEQKEQEQVESSAQLASTAKRFEKQQQNRLKARRNDGRGAIQNTGTVVERKALNPWETYVQSLLFSNEFAYVN